MTTIVKQALTNGAFGVRAIKPVALACIHITGNKNTAAMPDLRAAAKAERDYANRPDSKGPSAHYYVARDGWAIEAIDPIKHWAWSNGDVNAPNLANPGIKAVLAATQAKGINPNQAYVLEFENVGFPGDYPITLPQKTAMAAIIAREAKRTGLPISRQTVHGHWEINSVDRWRCPSGGPYHETFLNDVITRAKAALAALTPAAPVDPTPFSQADLDAAAAKAADAATVATTASFNARLDAIKAKVATELDALIADLQDD